MTHTDTIHQNRRFGVGQVFGETFGVFFSKFFAFLLVGAAGALIPYAILIPIFGLQAVVGNNFGQDIDTIVRPVDIVAPILSTVTLSIVSAVMIQMAYDAKLEQPLRIKSYVVRAIRNILPIVILTIVYYILLVIGFTALIVPGLWMIGVFGVIVPCILYDKAGFSALGHSARLTKGYRWPIVGTVILFVLVTLVVVAVFGALFGLAIAGSLFATDGNLTGGVIFILLFGVVGNAIFYGLGGTLVAMIYARLRELKDGSSLQDVASVFE